LQNLTCRKSILAISDGTEHLLLRDQGRVLQVLCIGETVAMEPCAIGLLADEIPNVRPKVNLMLRFAGLYRERNPGGAKTDWSPRSKSLRDALVALDGSLNGASYREIAAVIYGPKTVSDDWHGGQGYLKNRVVRAVASGHRLMNGGYRELLS